MTLHREGRATITIATVTLLAVNLLSFYFLENYDLLKLCILLISLLLLAIVLQFFRKPYRKIVRDETVILAPCDGKVVVIEETMEDEYYKDKRIQVSIFMSPFNVHINWYPVSGLLRYIKYHKGKYLVAWDPKASTQNERSTIVIEKENKVSILVRQIAGALAKRIVYYGTEKHIIKQGAELGFIKFGSRVDVFLPLGTKINVQIGEKTTGGVTVLAEL